jgi:sulfopyruvate decarboxylase TPP-binding subunit
MTRDNPSLQTAAAHLLYQMKRSGVDHLLANPGTDFPSIIEALSADAQSGAMPKALAIHHENVAVGMAHGYHLVSGKMAAVMVHVNVGLANCTMGALNAAASQVPMLLMSGRSPITETGRHGSRQTPIHWGQEMFNQASLVQEATKWTYELRYPEQAATVVQRAVSIAQAARPAPVYVSLPREVLAEPVAHQLEPPVVHEAWGTPPNPQALEQAAKAMAQAQRVVVVVQRTPAPAMWRSWPSCSAKPLGGQWSFGPPPMHWPPTIRRIWVLNPRRCCRKPMPFLPSAPWCRGRHWRRHRRKPMWLRWVWTRWMRAFRTKAFAPTLTCVPIPTWRFLLCARRCAPCWMSKRWPSGGSGWLPRAKRNAKVCGRRWMRPSAV